MSQWLVDRASKMLESYSSRRSFLQRTAVAATALSVAPLDFALRPVSAYAAVCGCAGSACDCSSLCCDGYTEFCCTLTGSNTCPSGTFVGGWWKADGSIYCNGPRYYIDCMGECTNCANGCGSGPFCNAGCDNLSCGCALGHCANRHAGCTTFRYGQCHQEIGCSGRIACRVASCTPPWLIDSSCTTSSATDDFTANHNVPCLERPLPPPARWSGWAPLLPAPPGGTIVGAPAVASWAPGRLDLFARGVDNHLWHRWSADGGASMSAWEDLGAPGGAMKSSPAAVSWGTDRIDVFARGRDDGLWHLWWDGAGWRGWENRGGVLASAPAVSSWGAGRLDVFVVGTDQAIWHTFYTGVGWCGFESRGGTILLDPGAVSWGPDRVDLFAVGLGNLLYHSWWDGSSWSGWVQEVAGTWASGPAVASWQAGRVDVFLQASGSGHPMGHPWYFGNWNEDILGGNLTSAPAAVSWGPQRIDTFVRGTDGNIYHQWYGS